MNRICLITCYMGPLPVYFDYFVASCKKNKTIDFVVINDSIRNSSTDQNLRYIKMNLDQVNSFASQQMGTSIKLQSAWKINELKPAFGTIFRDLLKPYDYWGWCDLDIIWGDLRHFLTDDLLGEFDVISSKEFWSAGHFTLLKNTPVCNELYNDYEGVIKLLNDENYYAFEECCHRWHGKIFTFDELAKAGLPVSMFDIIKQAEAHGKIRARFKDVIREHPQPINFIYKNGKLIDQSNNEEFMYYHLITIKKIWRFFIPAYQPGYDSLVMSPYGIRSETETTTRWFIRRAYSCYKGIRKSAKKQNTSQLVKKLFGLTRDEG